jgi:hypothetical protein
MPCHDWLTRAEAGRSSTRRRGTSRNADLLIGRRFANLPHKCFGINAGIEGFWAVGDAARTSARATGVSFQFSANFSAWSITSVSTGPFDASNFSPSA